MWNQQKPSLPGSIKPVYGAQFPPKSEGENNATSPKLNTKSSPKKKRPSSGGDKKANNDFFKYETNTEDAWDLNVDDIACNRLPINLEDAKSSAKMVLQLHEEKKKVMDKEKGPNKSFSPRLPQSIRVHEDRVTRMAHATSPARETNNAIKKGTTEPQSSGGQGEHRSTPTRLTDIPLRNRDTIKLEKFRTLLSNPNTSIDDLRELSWSGIPHEVRPVVWKLLCGYIPPSTNRQCSVIDRKRSEYKTLVEQYFNQHSLESNNETYRQIHIDVPRMNPLIAIFQQKLVQDIFERILFIWSIRHPASGYVQGINDLVTPFFIVFLSEYVADQDFELEDYDMSQLTEESRAHLEADCFWCLGKLMDGIQDNYTFAQPGIQRKVQSLEELIKRINVNLHNHLKYHSIEYLQFSFRWMNNLLMRELPLRCVIRLWDTYQAEVDGFSNLHLYVCASLMQHFSYDLLKEKDFQGLMLLLQNLPTFHWHNDEIGVLLALAYKLKYSFADAPQHLKPSMNNK